MLFKFNMVVDIYPGGLASGIFVRFFRQRSQIRAVDVFKLLPPSPPHCQHDLIVKPVYLFPDGTVNFVNSWTHGLDLTMLRSEIRWTLGSLAYGLFNVTLTGFLVGALFACLYNLVGRARGV